MDVQLHWIDWSRPALRSAVQWLAEKFCDRTLATPALDLSNFIIVTPGTRSRHRLLELLIQISDQQGLLFTPPQLTTVGQLPEQLYLPGRPFASELTQQVA